MNKILVLAGPSGSGKSTIEKYAKEHCRYVPIVSATTRTPRVNEVQGKSYWFHSHYNFLKKVVNNEFVEYAMYNEEFYGVLKSELEEKLKMGNVVCVLESIGAHKMLELYPNETVVVIIDLPNEMLKERMIARKDDLGAIEKRLSLIEDMRRDLEDISTNVVINDGTIEETWEKIENLIKLS